MNEKYTEAELIETLPAPAKEAIANANLPASKAASIVAVFKPCMEELNGFSDRLEGIFGQADITEQLSRDAKRLRLDIAKVRVAGDKVRKAAKEESLRYGQAIDGVYRFIALAASENESRLEDIEKHQERIEAERRSKLHAERCEILAEYGVDGDHMSLGNMEDVVWENFLAGTIANHNARIEAERKAEAERIAREKAEAEERERIRIENERLRAEAVEREKAEAERRAKEAAEKAKLEAKLKKEREAARAKLEAERKERERAEAELRSKREAEEAARREADNKARAEAEAKARAEKAAQMAPDREKLELLAKAIIDIRMPDVKSEESMMVVESASDMLTRTAAYIMRQVESMLASA